MLHTIYLTYTLSHLSNTWYLYVPRIDQQKFTPAIFVMLLGQHWDNALKWSVGIYPEIPIQMGTLIRTLPLFGLSLTSQSVTLLTFPRWGKLPDKPPAIARLAQHFHNRADVYRYFISVLRDIVSCSTVECICW